MAAPTAAPLALDRPPEMPHDQWGGDALVRRCPHAHRQRAPGHRGASAPLLSMRTRARPVATPVPAWIRGKSPSFKAGKDRADATGILVRSWLVRQMLSIFPLMSGGTQPEHLHRECSPATSNRSSLKPPIPARCWGKGRGNLRPFRTCGGQYQGRRGCPSAPRLTHRDVPSLIGLAQSPCRQTLSEATPEPHPYFWAQAARPINHWALRPAVADDFAR